MAGEMRRTRRITEQVINKGIPVNVALERLVEAAQIVNGRYERREYLMTDVTAASSAMKEAVRVLEPHLRIEVAELREKVAIGTFKGCAQRMERDLSIALLKASGLSVVDAGVDLEPEALANLVDKEGVQAIILLAVTDEVGPHLKDVINHLSKRNLRDKVKVIISSRMIPEKACEEYGADICVKDALDCLKKLKQYLSVSSKP